MTPSAMSFEIARILRGATRDFYMLEALRDGFPCGVHILTPGTKLSQEVKDAIRHSVREHMPPLLRPVAIIKFFYQEDSIEGE